MTASQNRGTQYLWGPSFMDYLAGGEEVSFEAIQNDIYYLVSGGSEVVDVIGKGTYGTTDRLFLPAQQRHADNHQHGGQQIAANLPQQTADQLRCRSN